MIGSSGFWLSNNAGITAGIMAAVICLGGLIWLDEHFAHVIRYIRLGIRRHHNHILVGFTVAAAVMFLIGRIGICLSGWVSVVCGIIYLISSLWLVMFGAINFDHIRKGVRT